MLLNGPGLCENHVCQCERDRKKTNKKSQSSENVCINETGYLRLKNKIPI